MSGRLEGKVIIITGAAGGIGRALVNALLEEGASVTATEKSEVTLAQLIGELEQAGHGARLLPSKIDVSDYGACQSCIEDTLTAFGRIDGLINNAALGMGMIRSDHMTHLVRIEELDGAIWNKMISVNLSGAWNMTRHAFPIMRTRGFGRIINVTTSFFTMLRGGFHPYGPAKAGLEAMSLGHAREFSGTGVTVNVVVPGGPADTPMVPKEAPYARRDLIDPTMMAHPVIWLCGEADDTTTGQRYVAANWNVDVPPAQAARACGAPAAWPELAQNPVWPGGKPKD